MPLVNVGLIPMPIALFAQNFNSSTIDAADEMAWSAHVVFRSGGGTITHVHFRTGAVTTGETLDVRIESGDANDNPSGSLWAANTNGAQVIGAADDNVYFRTALTSGATVALGDRIFPMVKAPGVSAANMSIARGSILAAASMRSFPYSGGPLATNELTGTLGSFALEYDDGYIEYCADSMPSVFTIDSYILQNSGALDEAGLLFTPSFTCRTCGWWMHAGNVTGTDVRRVALYAAGNNTPLATSTISASQFVITATPRAIYGAWDNTANGVTLTGGSSYRLALVAPNGDTTTLYGYVSTIGNTLFDSLGFPGAQLTSRNRTSSTDPDTVAWTENPLARPQMGLIIDQL